MAFTSIRRRAVAACVAAVLLATTTVSCGGSEPANEAIQLQAAAVGGGQVFYEDLTDQDTVLWFWAPW